MSEHCYMVKGLPVFLSFQQYTAVTLKCIKEGYFTDRESFSTEFAFTEPKVHKKMYHGICKYLESVYETDRDDFISHYYNSSFYDESARNNVTIFLISVASIYTDFWLETISGLSSDLNYLYGEKYYLNFGKKNEYTQIKIDTSMISCFWGSIDCFHLHFKDGFSVGFNRGRLTVYHDESYRSI